MTFSAQMKAKQMRKQVITVKKTYLTKANFKSKTKFNYFCCEIQVGVRFMLQMRRI